MGRLVPTYQSPSFYPLINQGHPVLHGEGECEEGHQVRAALSDQGGGIFSQIVRAVK